MAKFKFQENEKVIGSGMMAYKFYEQIKNNKDIQNGFFSKRYMRSMRRSVTNQYTRGNIYVTNQRVCYIESWTNACHLDLSLSDVKGYKVKHVLFITFVHIYDKDENRYIFSGFPAKKLQGWLNQVGVHALS